MDINKTILNNGIRLITIPIEGVASTSVIVTVGVGSRYEQKSKNGISHVLEHMAFKGTEKRPSPLAIAHQIESVGGEWNAFTSNEMTAYWVKTGSDHFETSLDVLSDILTNSQLSESELIKELDVIKEEMKMYRDDPASYVQEVVEEEIFGDQPIGWPVIGNEKSVDSVKRQDLQELIENYYRTGNMVIGIAGKIPKDADVIVAKFFEKVKPGERKEFNPAILGPTGSNVTLITRDTEQTHLAIGLAGLSRLDPDFYSMRLLATILGKGMSSRLFTTVREQQGLAYAVYTAEHGYSDTGFMLTYAGVTTSKIEQAISAILDQFSLISSELVTEAELNLAKEYLKGHLKLKTESTSWVAEQMARQELLDNQILSIENIISLIDRVTVESVFRVAKALFSQSNLKMGIVGPFKDDNRFQKLLEV